MEQKNFDIEFQKITREMVEISFELLNFLKDDLDTIFILGSIEEAIVNFKMFYNINGVVSKAQDVNKYSKNQYDLSSDRQVELQRLGNKSLMKINQLFALHKRDIPTLIKIKFWPKTERFECKLQYELQYSHINDKGFFNVFNDWFDEERVQV